MILLSLVTKIFFLLFLFSPELLADGFDRSQASPENASDAQINDDRLPPLLPGEVVKRGNKKIRVLTTVGPVPVAPVDNSWPVNGTPSGLNVIVDAREENGQQKWPHQHTDHKGIQHKQNSTKVTPKQSDSYIESDATLDSTE